MSDEATEIGVTPAVEEPPQKAGLLDVLCLGPILLTSLYRLLGGSLTALWIGTHPVRLNLIRATYASMVAVGSFAHGGGVLLWVALLSPLISLGLDDPFYYWAGRRYGHRLVDYLAQSDPGWKPRIARGERIMRRWGFLAVYASNLPVVPIPVSVVYFVAGDSRMNFAKFLLADALGLFTESAMLVGLGYLLGKTGQAVAAEISKYGGMLSIAMLVAIVGWVGYSTYRNYPQIQAQVREREEERRRRP